MPFPSRKKFSIFTAKKNRLFLIEILQLFKNVLISKITRTQIRSKPDVNTETTLIYPKSSRVAKFVIDATQGTDPVDK